MRITLLFLVLYLAQSRAAQAQQAFLSEPSSPHSIFMRSPLGKGSYHWKIKKVSEIKDEAAIVSNPSYSDKDWLPAMVPGTVLSSLVANGVYPNPYFGDNNRKENLLIPDIIDKGIEFYHYWWRTNFAVPKSFLGKRIWLKFHGINYRTEIWINGKKVGKMDGMFNDQQFDVTHLINKTAQNTLAVKVRPIDAPGNSNKKNNNRTGAIGENKNGGDGEIGKNVTMLMSVGWDFTAPDGIRDRNTGLWKDVELFATGPVLLQHPFVMTKMPLPDTSTAKTTITVEAFNATAQAQTGVLEAKIPGAQISISKTITLKANERRLITLSSAAYKQLLINKPKLWWPVNKGKPHLYELQLAFNINKVNSAAVNTKFGIREISTDQDTPDQSRRFLVNGVPIFIKGSNWVPEAMLKNDENRTYAELRYTKQSGINFLRLWGGGIAESDYFYRLCDEMGIMVWSEFWITGDTRFPVDTALYFKNLTSTIKRIRNHASSAYYVSANESKEIDGAGQLIYKLDPTKGYQSQSECCGIHDGSPYKYENPMQYFENTASKRGSRIDGFNPEYGTPILPILSSLKKMMPEKDLWPIQKQVWDYLDGGGFHQMTTKYHEAVEEFGKSNSIAEYAKKAQAVGAMNYRALWEVWNYNKFNSGDRYASGLLFWYHNSPVPQTSSRFYDWFLEPTAGLYYSQNALEPLHPQFDYLKNTVSVANDFRIAFKGYQVKAIVYNLDSKPILSMDAKIDIPADGLAKDVLKISFPSDISSVHFIKLILTDELGKHVAESFYWRSNAAYQGAWTITGPAVSGFEEISKLAEAKLKITADQFVLKNKTILKVKLANIGNSLAFLTQLRLLDQNGESVKPAFYSDNFVNLLPADEKMIEIEISKHSIKDSTIRLAIDAFNVNELIVKPVKRN